MDDFKENYLIQWGIYRFYTNNTLIYTIYNDCLIRQAEAASASALDGSNGIVDFGNDSGK